MRKGQTTALKRVIVDYKKLDHKMLNLLVEKFPDGYDDDDIVTYRNASNEVVECVEVRTEDTSPYTSSMSKVFLQAGISILTARCRAIAFDAILVNYYVTINYSSSVPSSPSVSKSGASSWFSDSS